MSIDVPKFARLPQTPRRRASMRAFGAGRPRVERDAPQRARGEKTLVRPRISTTMSQSGGARPARGRASARYDS